MVLLECIHYPVTGLPILYVGYNVYAGIAVDKSIDVTYVKQLSTVKILNHEYLPDNTHTHTHA